MEREQPITMRGRLLLYEVGLSAPTIENGVLRYFEVDKRGHE